MNIQGVLLLLSNYFPLLTGIILLLATGYLFSVLKKFGTGILSSAFRLITLGVGNIAVGTLLNGTAFIVLEHESLLYFAVRLLGYILILIGAFLIIKASKETAEKMQTLTK